MRNKVALILTSGLFAALAIGLYAARDGQPPAAPQPKTAPRAEEPAARDDKSPEAAREAIRQSARQFEKAFDRGDAKAVAAFWTEDGEYHDNTGVELRGRAAIEKAYAEVFREKPKGKLEIEIQAIRLPSPDSAIEDGILRTNPSGAELPTSTRYSVLHVRSGDGWKMAVAREYGADEYKLDELQWLVGKWLARVKDREIQLTYEWDENKTFLRNTFSVKEGGKVTWAGTQMIGMDPKTGQVRSWLFDNNGGNGQGLWIRDGNRWLIDSVGELSDGSDTFAVNVLTRLGEDEFMWRSIDRVIGNSPLPNADPVKLTRVK
jgi:uncharacterized protein (TIGR02246 family)